MSAPLDILHALPTQLSTLDRPVASIADLQPEPTQSLEEQRRAAEIQHCASAILKFAETFVPPTVITEDKANPQLLDVASTALAANWLRQQPETTEDSQVAATVILGIFKAIPAPELAAADRQLMNLRAQYGSKKPAGIDTTYGTLARIDGRMLVTRVDKGGLGERLTDEQLATLEALNTSYRAQKQANQIAARH